LIELNQIRIFLAAARHLNFLQAARELGLSPPQVSKEIARLEEQLEKRLFHRTTRVVRLSREGERLVIAARRTLEAAQALEEVFQEEDSQAEVAGRIRMTCSHTLAIRQLAPCVAAFQRANPGVELSVMLADSYLDLIEEGVDMAIRIMTLGDSTLIARKLADNPVVFCASRKFLKQHPVRTIADLRKVPIFFVPQHADLVFQRCHKRLRDIARKPAIESANGDFLVELAKQDAGLLVRSRWAVERELAEKSLVEIDLSDTLLSPAAIYAVYPAGKFLPRRLRHWIDFLVQWFEKRR
jgi:DNA-binding transcriptional LysR family regulator